MEVGKGGEQKVSSNEVADSILDIEDESEPSSYPSNPHLVEEIRHSTSPHGNSPHMAASPTTKTNATPLMESPRTPRGGGETAYFRVDGKLGYRLKVMVLFEWIAFVCILGVLITGLTVDKLQRYTIWSFDIWKWCVLALAICCGRLISGWFIHPFVFLIERNFLLRKRVLFVVYGTKNIIRVLIRLSLILLAWGLLFNLGVRRSKKTTRILNYITRALAYTLLGAGMWMVKVVLADLLTSSFLGDRFFDRIQESIFHQYVLETLSGPPLMEFAERVGRAMSSSRLSFKKRSSGKQVENEEVIDVRKLHKMKQGKISTWTMRGLIKVIEGSSLHTVSTTLDGEGSESEDNEITNVWEAKAAAYHVFQNIAPPGCKYIDEVDLRRFMIKEEVDLLLPMFEGAETGKIKKSSLRNWVVNVFNERKSLACSLNDCKAAIEELNRILSGITLVVIIVVWFILMGFATTEILIFILSQLFIFGNTYKNAFEAIIFVFVVHPFDVGDRCVIDGVQMVVEEINILTTVFLRYDNEKIYYPNSVLATKPISNFYRSPEMGDSVEFAIDASTPAERIVALKAAIKVYLESKPGQWRYDHSVLVKDIEEANKMKMALHVNHTMNFQNYQEKSKRRSDLVFELKKFFEELGIKYQVLPQEVHRS